MGPSEFYSLKTVLQIRVTAFKTYNFLYYVNNFLLRGVNDTAELDSADSAVSMTPQSLTQQCQ